MAKSRKLLLTALLAVVCLVASLCAVLLPTATPARAEDVKYENTNATSFVASDKSVMLVYTDGTNFYAMTALDSDDDYQINRTQVTVDEDGKITSTVTDAMLWIIESTDDGGIAIKSVARERYIPAVVSGAISQLVTTKTTLNQSEMKLVSADGGASLTYSMNFFRGSEYTAATFAVYEQESAGGNTPVKVTVTKYEKFDITNLTNFKVGDSVSGILVATYSGNPYAMTMYSSTSTSPNKALFVELNGDTLTAINANTNSNAESSRKMSSDIEGWMTFTVTRTASGVTLQSNSAYSSAQDKYVTLNNYGSFSLVANSTVFSIASVADGFTLKNSSNYAIKLDSMSNFGGNTNTYGTAATFTFYKKTEIAINDPVTITFDNGSSEATGTMSNAIVEKGSEYTLPSCSFARSKYLFDGWSVNGETKQVGDTITVNADTTVTALWAENWWTVTLTMEGQEDHIETVQKGSSIGLKTNNDWWAGSTPEGKLFSCWQLNGEAVSSTYTPTDDVTLVAVFVDAVTVSFEWGEDGQAPSDLYRFGKTTVKQGEKYTLYTYVTYADYRPTTTKEGYVFDGWAVKGTDIEYRPASTTSNQTESVTINENTVFVALWRYDGFTITFMVGDEVYATKNHTKVTEQYSNYSYYYAANGVEAPTAPAGQIFTGWTTTSNYNSNNKYSVYNASSYSSSYLTLPRESSNGGITNYNVVLTANFAIAAVFHFQNEDGTVYKTETKTLELSKESVSIYLTTSYAGTIPSGYGLVNWTDEDNNVYTSNQYVYIYSTDTVYEKTLTVHYGRTVTISFDFNGGSANSGNPNYFPENKTYEYAAGTQQSITTGYQPEKTNYVLTGWKCGDLVVKSGDKFTVADEDMCFVAQWKYDGITITFADGTNTTDVELANGTTLYTIAIDDPTAPTGQKFLGWQIAGDDSGTLYSKTGANKTITIDGDEITLNAVYRALKTYNVTLHYGATSKTVQFAEGTQNILFNVDTFKNNEMGVIDSDHIFMGWYKEETFTTQMSTSYLAADDSFEGLHLYAKLDAYFHVLFDYGFKASESDETNIIVDKRAAESSQGVTVLSTDSGADYHARDKFTLLGWATEVDGEVAYAADGRTYVTAPCTLYAVWDYNYYVITVKLAGSDEPVGIVEVAKNRNGNTLVKINELKDNSDALVINWTAVNVEGQDATWTVIKGEDEGRDTAVNEPITLTSDITLQVRFSDHIYTITVNWVGGKLAEIKQAYNTDVTAPETEKAGYSFVAFYLNNEQGGEYTFDKMPAQDIVVWAKYEILDSTLKFDTGDGSEIADITQKTGTVVDKPADPTREGYEFVKWQIDGNDVTWLVKEGTGTTTNPEYYINMPGGITTMVAKWELTAEGLAAIKTAKLAELDAYVTEKGVDLPESYSNAISNATTEAGVNEALTAAKAKVDELKAEKDAAAQALANAKTAAKAEVAAKAAEDGVTAPSTADIDDATTIEQVNTAKAAALAAIAQAKADKDAAETAQALANAKTAAKAEVAAKAAEDGVTAPSTADIDAATTIEQVNTAKAAALAAIAQAKADKDAAEAAAQALANAKTAAKAAVEDALVEGITLAESFTQAIDNAATLEAVETAKQAALTEIERLIAAKEEAEAAQALANAKTAAKAEVAAKAAEDGVTAPSTADIDAATTIEQVNTAKAAALAAIAQAKADKDAAEAAAAESKAKVDAAKAKIAALSGKKGAELFAAIKEADTAIAALTADEKAQLDMADYNAAKTAYNAYATATIADLDVAVDVGMACAAVKVATAVAALAMLTFVLKRRMW